METCFDRKIFNLKNIQIKKKGVTYRQRINKVQTKSIQGMNMTTKRKDETEKTPWDYGDEDLSMDDLNEILFNN